MKKSVKEWVLQSITRLRPERSVTDHLGAGFHTIPQS
jgi:hypothetical protein